jgi:hypothetical protein
MVKLRCCGVEFEGLGALCKHKDIMHSQSTVTSESTSETIQAVSNIPLGLPDLQTSSKPTSAVMRRSRKQSASIIRAKSMADDAFPIRKPTQPAKKYAPPVRETEFTIVGGRVVESTGTALAVTSVVTSTESVSSVFEPEIVKPPPTRRLLSAKTPTQPKAPPIQQSVVELSTTCQPSIHQNAMGSGEVFRLHMGECDFFRSGTHWNKNFASVG